MVGTHAITQTVSKYRAKRSPGETPEPFEAGQSGTDFRQFVVQKHKASRLHYDFRLEVAGVLVSWAVPKGPSMIAGERRLAIQVEDHPLAYADFEGIIPPGNYGAGAVIIWDRGTWEPVDDPIQGLREGKLHFELTGRKLRGQWSLIRMNRKGDRSKQWLLIKKADDLAVSQQDAEPGEQSVVSGLTVDEIAEASHRAHEIRDELAAAELPMAHIDPARVPLALCRERESPFTRSGWIFELKYDGYRLLAAARDKRPYLRYRGGSEATEQFPELSLALGELPYSSLLIDGEVVVFDKDGRSNFMRVQKRAMLSRKRDIRFAQFAHPATFIAFDLLECEGFDLRSLPLARRKELLRRLLPGAGVLRYCDHVEECGEAFYQKVIEMDLEGIVAKKSDSPYPSGRTDTWLKIRPTHVGDFAVVGYTLARDGVSLGSLDLAALGPQGWHYAGSVGSGLSSDKAAVIAEALASAQPAEYSFDKVRPGRKHVWVAPGLVAMVRYKEWPPGGLLRQPVFLRLRDDKAADECELLGQPPPALCMQAATGKPTQVQLTNLDKVLWPGEGYTKGELIAYYQAVSPWLLPYLRDRPVVLTRYPNGIDDKSFYQKDTPDWVPSWIRRQTIWSEHAQREIRYCICDDLESLTFLANLASIVLHVWASRAADLVHPDWCIIDLDPKNAPFAHVVTCALAIRDLLLDMGLPSYVKTSGSTGLHVLIPLGGQCTYEQSRKLAQLIAQIIQTRHRDIATTDRNTRQRKGRVYLDCLQNRHGQVLVAPFSVRPLPGAPVSTPLHWSEVRISLNQRELNMKSTLARLEGMSDDPLLPVLSESPDLLGALDQLAGRLDVI